MYVDLHHKEGDQGNASYWYLSGRKARLPRTTRSGMATHGESFARVDFIFSE